MKKIMLLVALVSLQMHAQFTELPITVNNPDRGFYYEAISWDTGWPYNYLPLQYENDMSVANLPADVSLIRRIVRLDAYKGGAAIPPQLVELLRQDLIYLRSRNLKCILRFTYWDNGTGATDASLATIINHIESFKPATLEFEGVISSMEAGFIGRWGEWHDSTNFGNPINPVTSKVVADSIFSMTHTRFVAFRTPTFMRYYYPNSKLPKMRPYYTHTNAGRTAMYNDAFLHNYDDDGTFTSSPYTLDRDYLAIKSSISFTGGESNEWNVLPAQWQSYANCIPPASNAVNMTAIQQMEAYHYNHLNLYYYLPVINYWNTQGFLTTIRNRLGYRYVLNSAGLNTTTKRIVVDMQNLGFANCINRKNVYLVLEDMADAKLYKVNMSGPVDTNNILVDGFMTDVHAWEAGNSFQLYRRLTGGLTTTAASPTVAVGQTVPLDHTYKLYLEISDPLVAPVVAGGVAYPVRIPSAYSGVDVWDSRGFNKLFKKVKIKSDNTIEEQPYKPGGDAGLFNVAASRNPFTDSFDLTVDVTSEEMVSVKIFDMVGKLVSEKMVNSKDAALITLGGELATGVYNVVVMQGEDRKAIRIVKQ